VLSIHHTKLTLSKLKPPSAKNFIARAVCCSLSSSRHAQCFCVGAHAWDIHRHVVAALVCTQKTFGCVVNTKLTQFFNYTHCIMETSVSF